MTVVEKDFLLRLFLPARSPPFEGPGSSSNDATRANDTRMTFLRPYPDIGLPDGLYAQTADGTPSPTVSRFGVRPDHLADYCLQAEVLHRTGRSPEGFKAYSVAAHPQPLQEEDIQNLTAERQHLARVVNRLSRSANFRQKVLNAYGHRCAVTRMQLKLVDAAHILPVGAPESSDHVSNGIALSATYHRAFDAGLIYLSADYLMSVNEARLDALRGLSQASGLDLLKQPLGKIALPPDEAQWPRKSFIQKANEYRQIKTA
jgi:putative restriction endonuclease